MYTILVMLIGHFCSKNGAIALIFHKNDDFSEKILISSILSQTGLEIVENKTLKGISKNKERIRRS